MIVGWLLPRATPGSLRCVGLVSVVASFGRRLEDGSPEHGRFSADLPRLTFPLLVDCFLVDPSPLSVVSISSDGFPDRSRWDCPIGKCVRPC